MQDIRQQADGDIYLSDTDFLLIDSTRQHQRDIIITRAGSMKHAPSKGVGAEDYVNDESPEAFLRKTRQEIAADGQKVKSVQMVEGYIEIKAGYEEN